MGQAKLPCLICIVGNERIETCLNVLDHIYEISNVQN